MCLFCLSLKLVSVILVTALSESSVPSDGHDINCSFIHDLCGWTQDKSDRFDWTRHSGATSTSGTGPTADHTTGNSYYIYIETTLHPPNSVARLVSPSFNLTNGHPKCLTFWYNMYGQTIGNLKVYFRHHGQLGPAVWIMHHNQGPIWKQAKVDIIGVSPLQVVFEASKGNGITGDIAIDDISTTNGICPGHKLSTVHQKATTTTTTTTTTKNSTTVKGMLFNCTFARGQCGWTQDRSDNSDWTRHSGSTTTYGTGPSGDHTNGSSYYMYFESSAGYPNAVARLISPPVYLAHGLPKCLIFWYNMYGRSVNNLKVYFRRHGQLGEAVWGLHGNQGQGWKEARVDITSSQLQVVFEASKGNGYDGDIAIDDISAKDGLCLVSFDCNFEGGLCEWKQGHGDTFDWTWHSGYTHTPSTGPSGDHTTGSGHYLYIESSQPRKRGDIARLISPVHPPTSGQCLQFYYNMYGASMGTLSVYVQPVGGRPVKIWTKSGNTRQKMWLLGKTDLKNSMSFILVFEGVVGEGYSSDMAIDDINISNKPCGQIVTTKPTVKPATQTTTQKHTDSINCDFDQNFCGWTQVTRGDQFDWTRIRGTTPSLYTGPDHDHTTGNGYYIYIETTGKGTGDKARLLSPQVPSGRSCIRFWYSMYGNSVGSLDVYIQTGTLGPRNPVWARRGNQGSNWIQGQIPVNVAIPYDVVFEGKRGMGASSDISLDDISITSGSCATVHSTRKKPTTSTTTKPTTTRATTKSRTTSSTTKSNTTPTTTKSTTISTTIKPTTTSTTTKPTTTSTTTKPIITGTTTRPTTTSTTTKPTTTSTTIKLTTASTTKPTTTSPTTKPTTTSTTTKPTTTSTTTKPTTTSTTTKPTTTSTTTKPRTASTTTKPTTAGTTTKTTTIRTTTKPTTTRTTTKPTTTSTITNPTTTSTTTKPTTKSTTTKPTTKSTTTKPTTSTTTKPTTTSATRTTTKPTSTRVTIKLTTTSTTTKPATIRTKTKSTTTSTTTKPTTTTTTAKPTTRRETKPTTTSTTTKPTATSAATSAATRETTTRTTTKSTTTHTTATTGATTKPTTTSTTTKPTTTSTTTKSTTTNATTKPVTIRTTNPTTTSTATNPTTTRANTHPTTTPAYTKPTNTITTTSSTTTRATAKPASVVPTTTRTITTSTTIRTTTKPKTKSTTYVATKFRTIHTTTKPTTAHIITKPITKLSTARRTPTYSTIKHTTTSIRRQTTFSITPNLSTENVAIKSANTAHSIAKYTTQTTSRITQFTAIMTASVPSSATVISKSKTTEQQIAPGIATRKTDAAIMTNSISTTKDQLKKSTQLVFLIPTKQTYPATKYVIPTLNKGNTVTLTSYQIPGRQTSQQATTLRHRHIQHLCNSLPRP